MEVVWNPKLPFWIEINCRCIDLFTACLGESAITHSPLTSKCTNPKNHLSTGTVLLLNSVAATRTKHRRHNTFWLLDRSSRYDRIGSL